MKRWDFPHGANLPGMPDFWQVEHCSTSIDDVLCHFRKRGTRKTAQPVPISHCHFPLRVWERISSHFFTFFTFFTYADLGTLGTRQGGPDLGTSGPRDLGTSGPRDLIGLVSASRSSASAGSATPSLSFFVASSCDEDTLCVWSRVACHCCFV